MSGNGYIVVFKDAATPAQIDEYAAKVTSQGGAIGEKFNPAVFKGFSAKIPDSFLASLQGDSIIDYIEPDQTVTTQ